MSSIASNLQKIYLELNPYPCKLIAVSKTYPISAVQEALDAGQLDFGENKVQEMADKYEQLPKHIKWHLIGHLQSNKVKYIAPFVHLIHSVDSLKLLKEINKEALKNERVISCLLQIYIASEDTKFGLSIEEAKAILIGEELKELANITIVGFMGMATNTIDEVQVSNEFKSLKNFFDEVKSTLKLPNLNLTHLSIGMSGDYKVACEEGSTMVRIGSAIFGNRNYWCPSEVTFFNK